MSSTNNLDLATDFVSRTVASIKDSLKKDIERRAQILADEIKEELVSKSMLQLNNLRVNLLQSIDAPTLEIRITVVRDEKK
jgi:hypothetical protein